MSRKNGFTNFTKAVKFAKSMPDIFTGETDNYEGEPNLLLAHERQVHLPIEGIDPLCPQKMYKIVSIHATGLALGVAPKNQEEGRPSRFRKVSELLTYLPEDFKQAVNQLRCY
jgi:hypothetical protein